jgi:hypothetical protein
MGGSANLTLKETNGCKMPTTWKAKKCFVFQRCALLLSGREPKTNRIGG